MQVTRKNQKVTDDHEALYVDEAVMPRNSASPCCPPSKKETGNPQYPVIAENDDQEGSSTFGSSCLPFP